MFVFREGRYGAECAVKWYVVDGLIPLVAAETSNDKQATMSFIILSSPIFRVSFLLSLLLRRDKVHWLPGLLMLNMDKEQSLSCEEETDLELILFNQRWSDGDWLTYE